MKTGHLDIRVDQRLIDRIDVWRKAQPIPPSRAATISFILDNWFTRDGPANIVLELKQPLTPPPSG